MSSYLIVFVSSYANYAKRVERYLLIMIVAVVASVICIVTTGLMVVRQNDLETKNKAFRNDERVQRIEFQSMFEEENDVFQSDVSSSVTGFETLNAF